MNSINFEIESQVNFGHLYRVIVKIFIYSYENYDYKQCNVSLKVFNKLEEIIFDNEILLNISLLLYTDEFDKIRYFCNGFKEDEIINKIIKLDIFNEVQYIDIYVIISNYEDDIVKLKIIFCSNNNDNQCINYYDVFTNHKELTDKDIYNIIYNFYIKIKNGKYLYLGLLHTFNYRFYNIGGDILYETDNDIKK
jgi:predicted transcriptional regulator